MAVATLDEEVETGIETTRRDHILTESVPEKKRRVHVVSPSPDLNGALEIVLEEMGYEATLFDRIVGKNRADYARQVNSYEFGQTLSPHLIVDFQRVLVEGWGRKFGILPSRKTTVQSFDAYDAYANEHGLSYACPNDILQDELRSVYPIGRPLPKNDSALYNVFETIEEDLRKLVSDCPDASLTLFNYRSSRR